MCGIAVAIDWPDAEVTVEKLIHGILHRGDITDPIVVLRPNTAMGTRRLRIVDGAHAIQPQIATNGRLALSFNGEIYNHDELRRELTDLGVTFRTASDTEVLANALQVWGYRALERVVGMYAFVALDIETGEFLAARDPFGVKPLYVIQSATGFLFCSEMRALLDAAETGDVMLLPPGFALSRKTVGRFNSPVHPRRDARREHDVHALDRILADAVATRMPPGLPVATLFSGGIDSTLIAHYTRRFRPEAPGYFVGGADAPDYPFAAAYADKSGLDLRLVPLEPESDDVFARIDEVIAVTESFEPNLVRPAVCALVAAERMHRDGFRVALCGEGADELFCGYPPLEIAFAQDKAEGTPFRDEVLGLMHRVSLQRVDRCSMRHALEMREPFLDPAVVDYALGVDAGDLVRMIDGTPVGKQPLRDLYNLYPASLPTCIRDRGKLPFDGGAGLDVSPQNSAWKRRFNELISDRELAEGQREFADFRVQSKEELYYLRKLSGVMDIGRVPHLRDRAWISFPVMQHMDKLKSYAHFSL